MTPEQIKELGDLANEAQNRDGFNAVAVEASTLAALVHIAKAAIPSGQVAEDEALLREALDDCLPLDPHGTPGERVGEDERAAVSRLAGKAQSVHEWFAKWEQAETLLNEYRAAASKAEALREDRDAWQSIAEERLSALSRIRSRAKDVRRVADVYLSATQLEAASYEGLAAALTWVLSGDGKAPESRQGEQPTHTANDVRMWTMRDDFAKAAMQGLLANPERSGDVRAFARDAVLFANALVETLTAARSESVEQAINGAKVTS